MVEEKKVEQSKKEEKPKEEEKEVETPATAVAAGFSLRTPAKFKDLVEKIEKMSVLDLAELVKVLEKKFGVSALAPVAVAAAPGTPAEGKAAQEEKAVVNIELTEVGSNKIGVIKAIRTVTEKGLKEAKDLVDSAPQIVKEGVKKEEAEEIKKKLEEVGARVTLR